MDQHTLLHPSALLMQSSAAGREVTWNLLVHSSASSLLMEISRRLQHLWDPMFCCQVAKMVAKFVAKVGEPDVAAASHPILIPVKLSSQS
ncbi:hypothetical protein AVEN_67150-1 [Araneus ventricosus]|uniref:Uncharacterized protein n=1 Tax=Araneus ventricosus TaxID=182803 RepID=A0A4Y2TEY6_ARAVE|nr:hypothetical protein AVEN_67150-1 [Araneus ventricosus]